MSNLTKPTNTMSEDDVSPVNGINLPTGSRENATLDEADAMEVNGTARRIDGRAD